MKPFSRQTARPLLVGLLLAFLLAASGCQTVSSHVNRRYDTTLGEKREVTNVYQDGDALAQRFRRVALLPFHKGAAYRHIDMERIERLFAAEILKLRLFEVADVPPERMEELFGLPSFSSVEPLPPRLLSRLRKAYGVDGVLLVDVTHYQPYRRVSLGVRAKLVEVETGAVVWAADELFDAASPAVANAARRHYNTKASIGQYPLDYSYHALDTPSRFAVYVAHALFSEISLQKN